MDETLLPARCLVLDALHELWSPSARRGAAADVLLGGFSQGAVMTYDVGFHLDAQESLLACGLHEWTVAQDGRPGCGAGGTTATSRCIVHGTRDPRIAVEGPPRRRGRCSSALGRHPEYHEFPMEHEGDTRPRSGVVRDFVHRVLPAR